MKLMAQCLVLSQLVIAESTSQTNEHICIDDSCSLHTEDVFERLTITSNSGLNSSEMLTLTATSISTSTSTVVSTFVSTDLLHSTETIIVPTNTKIHIPDNGMNETDVVTEDQSLEVIRGGYLTHIGEQPTDNSTSVQNNTNENSQHYNGTIDECHFLSFEEWKRQKIADNKQMNESQSQGEVMSNELISRNNGTNEIITAQSDEDQGKVYKERFNYASIDCAATIVKTNTRAKGASAILVENKDSYLLNQCSSTQKFVVIELCQDILVDTVLVGNFEFFSSNFRKIRISVSDRFPVGPSGMKVLGEFEAENIRDVQSFAIENPLIWARYLKLEVLSHYGDEFYCPISLIRVYGKTMMEEFKMAEGHESFLGSNTGINNEDLAINHSIKDISQFSGINIQNEECRVALPHLGLNEFLKDINATANDYCDAIYPLINEPETTHTTETIATQESIYKNIMKRLSLLESNASLSLLYIEEQSKLLSQAFTNLEKRQSSNFESLVSSFNDTMHNQISYFKNAYFTIQVEASNLFKAQEFSHQNLLEESHHKILMLGNQLKFQKWLSLLNTVIIICILTYVALTRNIYIDDHTEHPHYQEPIRASLKPSGYTNLINRYKKNSYKQNGKTRRKRRKYV